MKYVRTLLPALLLATITLVVIAAGPSNATTAVAPLTLEELTDHADAVIDGRVQRIESFVEGQNIFTLIHVTVSEAWKGDPAAGTVVLKLLGGEHAGMRTMVIGAPCITPGEHAVFFLKRNGARDGAPTYGVVSLAEGKFNVGAAQGDRSPVSRDLRGIHYLRESEAPMPGTLGELEAAVRASTGSQGGVR